MSDDLRIETLGHGSLAESQEGTENGTGVTHLPECHYVKDTDNVQYGWNDCICPELRACEQRLIREGRTRGSGVWHDGFGMGYADGLDAAIAAAENQHMYMSSQELIVTGFNVAKSEILHAIRSLKEKP